MESILSSLMFLFFFFPFFFFSHLIHTYIQIYINLHKENVILGAVLIWTFNSHYNTSLELFPNYLWSLYKKQNQGEKEMHENVILRIGMCMLTRSCPRRCLNHISMVEIHKKKGVYWGIIPLHYRELYWFWPITSITNLSFLPMS